MVNVKYSILGVEGPHDQALVGKLLELYGLEKFKGERDSLASFWEKFIPTYPIRGKLYVRLDMPSIFSSSTHSVAIYQGEGSNLCKNLKAKIGEHDPWMKDIHAFGLILDADDETPQQKATDYAQELQQLYPNLSDEPGKIIAGEPRTGIYVLPDNKNKGTLDNMLVDCAAIIYPDHLAGAVQFLGGLKADYTSHWRPYSREKATVATIVSVLKPGAANAASISQNAWICTKTVNEIAEVALLGNFLKELLELPEN
jgi:hypothetical protein